MINLTINDRPMEVPEGTTVLEAARKLGFTIPTLCYYEGLKPYGGCRLCMVEVTAGPAPCSPRPALTRWPRGSPSRPTPKRCRKPGGWSSTCSWSRCPEVPALQVMAQELGLAEPSLPQGRERLHPLRQMRADVP